MGHKLLSQEKVDVSKNVSEIKETVSTDQSKLIEACSPPQREPQLNNTNTDYICLMDISYDKKWICYVSQYEDGIDYITTTLSICRFTATNDETSKEEYSNPTIDNNITDPQETRVHMEVDQKSKLSSICIDKYFDTSKSSYTFLSISPKGQYIVLSTYDTEIKDADGSCVVFLVKDNVISFHCKLKCNGRAVFFDRENELCLAVISTDELRIYENIRSFSEALPYDLYDLKPFGTTAEDFKNSDHQHLYTKRGSNCVTENDSITRYSIHKPQLQHILALSTFVKDSILLTPYTEKSEIIRLWSLKNNGVRLSSLVAPKNPPKLLTGQAVIAISKDLKFAATVDYYENVVNVFNLDNGCLAYTLKSQIILRKVSHATFCYDSRYIALSAWDEVFENNNATLRSQKKAFFEVLNIEGEASIYNKEINISELCIGTVKYAQAKVLTPFVSEELTNDNKRILKGFYMYTNLDRVTSIRCLEIKMDSQQCTDSSEWFTEDNSSPVDNEDADFDFGGMFDENPPTDESTLAHIGDSVEDKLNNLLDDSLTEYLRDGFNLHFEMINSVDDYKNLKCRHIEVGKEKFLVRCGKHMVQLWRFVNNVSDSDENEEQKYRLVYVKAYTNSNYKSFYLSPNIWRLETFKSIKFFNEASTAKTGTPLKPRIILNIVEDENFIPQQKSINLSAYTEEFILPVHDDKTFNYHKFEGACQTLYYLNILLSEGRERPSYNRTFYGTSLIEQNLINGLGYNEGKEILTTRREENTAALLEQTNGLIVDEIGKIDKKCTSFKTVAASKLLAMLASFEQGRQILKLLLKNESLILSLSNYNVDSYYVPGAINLAEDIRYDTTRFRQGRAVISKRPSDQWQYRGISNQTSRKVHIDFTNENALMILIRERQYHLYHLMLNHILLDSKKGGPESLLVLNDALLLLQELRNTDHYEKSCQKLSYLPLGNGALLSSEIVREIPYKADVQQDLIANIGYVHCFSSMERLKKTSTQIFDKKSFYSQVINTIRNNLAGMMQYVWIAIKWFWQIVVNVFKDSHTKPSNELAVCMVPLPYFNTYYSETARGSSLSFSQSANEENVSAQSLYKKESTFLQLAMNQHSEPNIWRQGDEVMAVLLQYKWNTFIKKRFYGVCIIYLIYYVSFCTGVQFALEMYNYDSTSSIDANGQHLASIVLFFISGVILLFFEVKQMLYSEKIIHYFKSWYNLVDLAAILFSFFTFLQLTLNWDYFYEVSSMCTLILWLHGIIRFRVYSSVGIALETIIQLFEKVISVLCILLIVIVGFTHSFIVLLRQQPDQYFQEQYGSETSAGDDSQAAGEATMYDLSSSNGFTDPFKALYQVWLFIFGVWDPITAGDVGDDRMVFILCMLFAFITVLIFTNMIIALMSSTVEEVKQRGRRVWITHFAGVLAEIEDLTFESTKRNTVNNPAFVFYLGNSGRVLKREEELRQENQELRMLLNIDEDGQR